MARRTMTTPQQWTVCRIWSEHSDSKKSSTPAEPPHQWGLSGKLMTNEVHGANNGEWAEHAPTKIGQEGWREQRRR